jgi:homoserine kinase type II
MNANISQSEIKEILEAYPLTNINSSKLLTGGSENANYLIETENEKFVLTICQQKSAQESTLLAELLIHLNHHNFNTSKIVKTKSNELISIWNKKPVMLKEFLEGKVITNLNLPLLKFIGRELANLHLIKAPQGLPINLSYGMEHFSDLNNFEKDTPFQDWLSNVKQTISPWLDKDLPKALIHGDIFDNNIIVSKDETTACIMDFEEAAFYYRIFDIGMTIIGTCNDNKTIIIDKINALLEGYQEIIKLTKDEKDALPTFIFYAGAAMAFWRYKNFRYIKLDPNMIDNYLGLKHLAEVGKTISIDSINFK